MKRIAPYLWPAVFVFGGVAGAAVTCLVRFLTGPGQSVPALQFTAALIAGLAFAVAVLTYRFNGRKSKTDLFTSMHDKLIDPDVQRGRKILNDKVKHIGNVHLLKEDEFECVNRSLALYDTLAMYSRRGNVIEADVLETWGKAMHRRSGKIRAFIGYRASVDDYESWPHLTAMLDDLEKNPPK